MNCLIHRRAAIFSSAAVCLALVCGCADSQSHGRKHASVDKSLANLREEVDRDEGEMLRLSAELAMMKAHLDSAWGSGLANAADEAAERAYPREQLLRDSRHVRDIIHRRYLALVARHSVYRKMYPAEGAKRSQAQGDGQEGESK